MPVEIQIHSPKFEVLNPAQQDLLGECPLWSPHESALYWIDIEGKAIRRIKRNETPRTIDSWGLPERVGCISLTNAAGVLIAALESQLVRVELQDNKEAQITKLADLPQSVPTMRANDGRCDRSGRLWFGTTNRDRSEGAATGGLYCFDERGLTGPHITGLLTSNGLGFSVDGRRMYLADSHPNVQTIWQIDLDLDLDWDEESKALLKPQIFVDMRNYSGRPDGAAVDAAGNYWICATDAGLVHCFAPDANLLCSIQVPMPKPTMCAFGDAELTTLFVTSLQPQNAQTVDQGSSASGCLIAINMKDLPLNEKMCGRGLPETPFSRWPSSLVASAT